MIDAWELYLRSTEGKPISETEFDMKVLPTRLMELTEEYDIKYSPDEIIPGDKSLLKNIFDAAVDLLVDVGCYNASTGRIIPLEKKEIVQSLQQLNDSYTVGEGNERIRVEKRGFEDKRVPNIIGGFGGAPLTDKWYTAVMQSFAMEPCVKEVHTGTLLTLNGQEIKTNTTAELMATKAEITLTREALRRAGKPGMSIIGTMSGTTSEGQCFPFSPNGLRSTDRLLICFLNELKVNWDVLKKALFCQQNNLGIMGGMSPVIGGYLGGAETTLIGVTAKSIAQTLIFGSPVMTSGIPNDVVTGYKTYSENLYAIAGTIAALTQNTSSTYTMYCTVASGMGSEKAMYEIAAEAGIGTATGAASLLGANTSSALEPDSAGGMGARILDEAATAFAGMSLEETNEIVVDLIKQYGGYDFASYKPAPARKFYELYDMKTLRPTREFEDSWINAKAKITDMTGLEFEA